ncbi:histidine kinase [Sulfodiicoccus acidiphilus]|uniref:Histidine kinase n=1 Tax=Sulfodiicoccus acidiphilus TaxID=1670455 RepID=A0A348B4B5_9CREN|nr:CBS domain-containing protein [Sulfodiicoccus acidiphilus]BBD73017.1 histidine kinase [Sulfodiicoccus acidiphilus]GGU04502.1 histidine kinase [Sulfodiicoccus acidiphilus]
MEVNLGSSVREALKGMIDKQEYHAVVLDEGEVVGILSLKDVASRLFIPMEEGVELLEFGNLEVLMETGVASVMTPDPVVAPNEEEAIRLMVERNVGAVPVVSTTYKGTVTEHTVLPRLFQSAVEARSISSRPIIFADEEFTVEEAMELMIKRNIRRLPVGSESNVRALTTLFLILKGVLLDYRPDILYEPVLKFSEEPIFGTTVGEVARKLYQRPAVGAAIVEDGIVTERDLVRLLYNAL